MTNCSVLESANQHRGGSGYGANAFCRFFIATVALAHARTVLSFFFSRPIGGGKMAARCRR